MASYEDIPCDIIETLILPKLPSKSLLKLMSVSKSWYSLIKSPKFIASNLKHQKRQANNPLIVLQVFGRDEETYYIFRYSPAPHHIKLSSPFYRFNYVVASYDGIICLTNLDGHVMLWNPSINKFKRIPDSPRLPVLNKIVGFGYNSLEDNYKLVVIRFGDVIQKQACAHVYSFNRQGYGINNSGWIEVSVPKYIDDNMSRITTCCFANEMIHWIIFRKDYSMVAAASIMTFDPKTNCFGEIMFPEILNGKLNYRKLNRKLELAVINNNIAVVDFKVDNDTVIVWRMEQSSKSWKPLYNIKLFSPKSWKPFDHDEVYIKKLIYPEKEINWSNWKEINFFDPKIFRKQKQKQKQKQQQKHQQQQQQQVVIITTCSGKSIVVCVSSDNSGVLDGALVATQGYTCIETLVLLETGDVD